MAIAKFKEVLSCDFDHLDALFYIAQEQQKLEEYDGEIKSLRYLCEALETQNKSNSIPICATSLLQGPFIPFVKSLYGKTISLEYARYWLGKRCLQLHRFSEASDALTDVVAAVKSDKFQASVSDNTLPSSVYLYRDCAFAMLKANKTKECVTLCDHGIKGLEDVDCVTSTRDRGRTSFCLIDWSVGRSVGCWKTTKTGYGIHSKRHTGVDVVQGFSDVESWPTINLSTNSTKVCPNLNEGMFV
ncbi:hypothetical protein AC249_AIPGENE10393 [Exaiptasia diaphana]|nr:hypothetical protein AC249_AIPGENE10393 [Exaiptasia diaphana]